MANYWAITIGINQYRHLQPLMHAQNDALFMHRFFTETAGVPADHCVLLSDLATSVGHQVVYPDKPALSEWVQTITQQVNADDVLWLFFSGYFVQLDGNDYLMPIDGDPGQIKETGLAAADLIETLAQLPTDKTLLVLDINRSQGSFSGQAIGRQFISLAESNAIPLLLSCQPEQYSHETFGVKHGIFTAALLEALRQKCLTLGDINEYVGKHLPALCDAYWRPIQNPVALLGNTQSTAVVIPKNQQVADVVSEAVMPVGGCAASSAADSTAADSTAADSSTVLAGAGGTLLATAVPAEAGQIGGDSQANSKRPVGENGYDNSDSDPNGRLANDSALAVTPPSTIVPVSKESSDAAVSGAKLRNWGLAALALLMVGVLLKQPFVRTAWIGLTDRIASLADSPEGENVEPSDANVNDADVA